MSPTTSRKDVLDLLSRGKINVDEAVNLLEQLKNVSDVDETNDVDPKVETAEIPETKLDLEIEIDEESQDLPTAEGKIAIEELKAPSPTSIGNSPRWLRIRVGNLETGKNKVAVNIPYSMVKFGLGIARYFSPEGESFDLDAIGNEMARAEGGMLVDVEDEESNEHVQIFLD